MFLFLFLDYMEVPRLRLHRASEHIFELNREIGVFIKTNPFGVQPKFYTENGQDCLSLHWQVKQEPPQRLGILAGECIHHLRAILDNIIWSLAGIHCSPRHPKISFPICKSPTDYKKSLKEAKFKGIKDFPTAAQNLIEDLQPYNRGHAAAPESHPLYILNELWNQDKHKAPDLMGCSNSMVALRGFNLKSPGGLVGGAMIEDGKKFAHGVIPKGGIKPNAHTEFDANIAFHLRGPAKGRPAIQYLMSLHTFIKDEIVAKFEPIFPKP